ncbi:MAG: response regulator, partial [Bacteroidales bacterium]
IKQEKKKHLPLDQLRVLFVDDDPVNLLLGRIILDKFGVKTDFSNSGISAMKKFKKGRYDIIFLDINMPDYNGIEITKKIRNIEEDLEGHQKTMIIAMTANAMKKQVETYMQSGIDSIILKPYQEETLYQKIVAYAIKINKD